ncbi:MAG TPA: NAD-glutamate dehydrogenase domain-containing protein [Candidatus Binataceae bacterium]|nr:NAD-glutamate dehydrogenase domain-containing protein [Candidatus Binataceae bacterium]
MARAGALSQIIERNFSGDEAVRLKLFAERLFAREPHDRIDHSPPDHYLTALKSAYEFFRHRSEPIGVSVTLATDETGVAVIETSMNDCPFIVDSLLAYFHQLGAPVLSMLHPVYKIARDADGTIVSFEQASSIEHGESLTYSELELPASAADAERIAAEVRAVLVEVRQATGDFDAMGARALEICEETAAQRALVEVRDFLRWLVQGGFVFLGCRHYDLSGEGAGAKFSVQAGSELGIMRDHDESRFRGAGLLDDIEPVRRKLFFDGPALVIGKTRAESRVHRRAPMDSVTIRRTNPAGRVTGFDHFVGLLTSKAYTEEAQHIPTLRAKLDAALEAEGAAAGSHDYKELVSAFNSFPKDELFRAPVSELRAQLHLILDVKNEATVRLCVLSDPYRGIVIAMVVMPREAFSASVRQSIQAALAAGLGGTLVYYYLAMGEGYTARLHFCFTAQPPKAQKIKELESEIARLAHRWEERLTERLIERCGAARGRALGARWAHAFSDEYRAAVPARRAILDIERIEELLRTGSAFHVELNRDPAADDNPDELRILGVGEPPILSELMPMLQNFGIKVLAEEVHLFKPRSDGRAANAYVQAFSVEGPDGLPLRKSAGAGTIADAIAAVRAGSAEDDPLSALVVSAGLKWREAALLRAYLEAAFQMRLAPARPALLRVLLGNPRLARAMFELFAARLDPDREDAADEAAAQRAAYLDQLSAIDNIADDRAARMLLSMVEATVRTNFFCPMPEPDPYLALKFDSGKIMGLPDTAPLYEIHVNSPRMAGCHLRAGKVARGGIRFSDRPDDFRTEILSLMKTQTVKNAIIVPIGSKGGFVVKHAADATGVEAYRTLIRALLDLTDNLAAHGAVHPPRVKVLDNDGPYLVVAADKGTAAFSDIANGIALERGFWLGDAFASGGEHGFDHKAMGITARGAWESARRHLREIGRDPDRGQPVTMIGIGDMSGDVFGNGLLRSRNLALIAAFDHRHVFIDPVPDPAASFEERRRLYELPRSSWTDYNPALISKGGGVWRRGQKRIEISPEARAALGITADALDGESLISAILRAPVDLLYNGGIGTYVRAGDETDEHVGDHANDGCRIAAAELRAKIAVEGGNLGFTQKARIEYALAGGRINTDAIDNSAGVDTSDHEVNLKILLDPEVTRGALRLDDRNRILAGLAAEVAASVLRDNRDQALLLSLEQLRSRTRVDAFREHMQAIEERGLLRRHEEALPTREALSQRHTRFAGLTRPELALITAYTKIDLVMRLEDSALTADPHLVDRMLKPYFPASIARSFDAAIPNHRLRRELIATRLVNEMVDLMGSTFVFEMVRDHGVSDDDAARGWLIASEVLAVSARAERIRVITAAAPAEAETGAFFALERGGRTATAWALRNFSPEIALDAAIGRFRPAFEGLSSVFEEFLQAGERERFERLYRELRALVADGELAHELARLAFADHLLNVLSVALARNLPPERVAEAYFGLGAHLDFSRLEAAVSSFDDEDRWRKRAAQELAVELREGRLQLTALALAAGGAAPAIEQLRSGRPRTLADLERLLAEIATMQTISMPAVHVAARATARLAKVD